MAQSVSYIKTLVIGLGSTGTRVCNELVRRIEWEMGSLERAPWVRFLAVETNSNEPSPLRRTGDFQSIGFRTAEYNDLLANSRHYDDKIGLERWADMDTLRKLSDPEGGAGNIRMVGRLALLHGDNFNNIKTGVVSRVESLRDLKPDTAQEKRGPLPDGTNPEVYFGADGAVRIFVVGTLCGGTCSGLAPDFGYFLRSFLGQEKIIGIFTLPHPQTLHTYANRIKKNAYSALVELNHYHLSEAGETPPIQFPDGTTSERFRKTPPYDLPYLLMPGKSSSDGEREVIGMASDRIFLNIFTPETDPYSNSVDASKFDLENQAHVFCTFGLSTVEVPAQQLTEACTYRLMNRALRRWQQSVDTDTSIILERIGLSWSSLRRMLLSENSADGLRPGGLEEKQKQKLESLRDEINRAPERSRELVDGWRSSLNAEGGVGPTLRNNRSRVVEQVYGELRSYAAEVLTHVYEGPTPLQNVLNAGLDYLRDLAQTGTTSSDEARTLTDTAVRELLEAGKRKGMLDFGKKKALTEAQSRLSGALLEELEARLDEELRQGLGSSVVRGKTEHGLAERLRLALKPVSERLRELDGRITRLARKYEDDAERLSREQPPVVGLSLFETGKSVKEEYERCLLEFERDSTGTLESAQDTACEQVIGSWSGIVDLVMPPLRSASEADVLMRPPGADEDPVGTLKMAKLLDAARKPFAPLSQVNVLERWKRTGEDTNGADRFARARSAAAAAEPPLRVNTALAEQGNRSKILNVTSLLLPDQNGGLENEFKDSISSVFRVNKAGGNVRSPNRFRVVLLNEWYRFPLRGLPQVLGEGGLQEADCEDFPTFQTRRDVYWLGLTRKDSDQLRRAEELLVLGVVLGLVEIKGGLLSFPMKTDYGTLEDRRFPRNFHGAARLLALEHRDVNSQSIRGAMNVLRSSIEQVWKKAGKTPEESSELFINLLLERLQNLYKQYPRVPIEGWEAFEWSWDRIVAYLAKRDDLYTAYERVVQPDQATLENLFLLKGARGDWGGEVPDDGYYCPVDGGLIGRDLQQAAQNGWRCFINPTHYYGPRARKVFSA